MYTKISEDLITIELKNSNTKPTLYSKHEYPLNELMDRDFEVLIYYLFKEEIAKGKYVGKFDDAFLMQGIGERGRDIILTYKGKNVGVVQCKKYNKNLNKPDFAKEVIKFVLNYLMDNDLISDISNFEYYIAVSSDFSEPVIKLLANFNSIIANEENLQKWVSEVIKKYQAFKNFDAKKISAEVADVLEQINVKRMSSKDINLLLNSNSNVQAHFFTIQKVISIDDNIANLKMILPSILADHVSAKSNDSKGVTSLKQFLEYQSKRSSKLPFTSNFYGREKDISKALEQLKNNFLLIVEGVPGIGKTRFCVELAKILENQNTLVYVLDINASNFTSLFLSNVEQGANILLFIDDLNRFENFEELRALTRISSDINSKIKIIVNTRNYYTENIIQTLNNWDIVGVSRIELLRLSKKEMDEILSQEPFLIKTTALRKEIILTCKGNPRLASIMAEIVRTDGSIKNKTTYEIFKTYFEGVFSELIQNLEGNYRVKVLLAVITGLRTINNWDNNTLRNIVKILEFDDIFQLTDLINTLISFEIIDLNPITGNIKVFDDSVSEYILFRYFFYDSSLVLNFPDVFSNFKNTHANLMIENLVALVKKGYESENLNKMIKKLPSETRYALFNDLENKSEYLEWMPLYAETCPVECFDVVNDYAREFIILLSMSELNQLLEICKKVYYKCWHTHLGAVLELMRIIINSPNPRVSEFQIKLLKFLEEAFNYHVIEAEDDSLRFFFGHQQFVLKVLNKWNKRGLLNESETAIALSILTPMCKNYFTHDTWDYLDSRRYNMTAGSLHLSPILEEIRKSSFSLLHQIYIAASVKDKLKIIEIYKSPFITTLHYGAQANKELMEYDRDIIKKIICQIYTNETNLILIDKIYGVLVRMQQIEKTEDITDALKRMRTTELDIFQKNTGVVLETS